MLVRDKLVVVGLGFFGVLALARSCQPNAAAPPDVVITNAPPDSPPEPQRPTLKISATTLYVLYEKNEVAANKRIGNAILVITGRVSSIDEDFTNTPVLKLAADESNPYNTVDARLDEGQRDAAASLEKGQQVTLVCDSVKRVIGDPVAYGCIIKEQP